MQSQVPQGYRQTEVGVIPEEWDVNTFDQICRVNQGLQIAIERRKKNPSSKSKIYITVQYVNSDDEPEYIDDYSSSVCCEPEDVLMTRTGNTGMIVTGETGVFHNNFFKIHFNREKISSEFFVYYLRSHDCQKTILEKAGTSTIPDLNHGDFYSIKIALPSFLEQTAIANALSDVDALITSLEKLIAKKRAIKTAAMQQLLTGKKRLPPFDQALAGCKQTELGEIPEDWECSVLGSFLKIPATYGIVKAGEFKNIGVPMLRGGDIKNGRIKENYPYVSPEKSSEYSRTVLEKDDVVIALVGYPGEAAKIPDKLVGGNVSRAVGLLRIKKEVSAEFMVCYLNSPQGRKVFLAPSAGSAQIVVNLVDLNKLIFPMPSLEEQMLIASAITDISKDIELLEQRVKKTQELKQGMMQELLTGRTRLV